MLRVPLQLSNIVEKVNSGWYPRVCVRQLKGVREHHREVAEVMPLALNVQAALTPEMMEAIELFRAEVRGRKFEKNVLGAVCQVLVTQCMVSRLVAASEFARAGLVRRDGSLAQKVITATCGSGIPVERAVGSYSKT